MCTVSEPAVPILGGDGTRTGTAGTGTAGSPVPFGRFPGSEREFLKKFKKQLKKIKTLRNILNSDR